MRTPIGRPEVRDRPIGGWAFTGVALTSLGGPLALAALIAPAVTDEAIPSGGFVTVAAFVVFAFPIAIWLRYAEHIRARGGLYAYVEAAAGRRVAQFQAAVWTFSYLLYIVYTTVQIVYDVLPSAVTVSSSLQKVLTILIPVALAATMLSGRRVALLVIGVIGFGQVAVAGILDGVTVAHLSIPASSFGTAAAGAGPLAKASVGNSLLYICASLPLFLESEVATPARTVRRGLVGAYVVTGILILLVVAPLASSPGITQTEIPGVAIASQFSTTTLARVIGIGVAVSIGGVMLTEYLALTRVLSAVLAVGRRPVTLVLAAIIVIVAPFSLIDPQGFYNALAQPSLVALWVSQLIVFAVYPRYAVAHGGRPLPAWTLGLVASAFAGYGIYNALVNVSS